jgi:NAD(P)-dependent dehydrogenase (short-subunit alcohol dehydrogenase family)
LDGRVAIVTGAGAGLGRAHALLLAKRGAAVLVNDVGGDATGRGISQVAEAVVTEIRAAGGQAVANRESVVTRTGGQSIVDQAMDEFGRVDIVVANAGILRDNAYDDYFEKDFDDIVDVHLKGSFWVTQAAYRVMKQQNYGRVVFTTSGSALYGQPNSPGYVAAKCGVVGLMHSLAVEGAQHGVIANAVAPIAYTRMTAAAFGAELEHRTRPELVANFVLYLVSEECAVTREIFEVGAGTYSRVFIGRTTGLVLDPSNQIDPETTVGHLEDIRDTSHFSIPKDVMAMLSDVFDFRFEYGGQRQTGEIPDLDRREGQDDRSPVDRTGSADETVDK